jgi:hypothetical protein
MAKARALPEKNSGVWVAPSLAKAACIGFFGFCARAAPCFLSYFGYPQGYIRDDAHGNKKGPTLRLRLESSAGLQFLKQSLELARSPHSEMSRAKTSPIQSLTRQVRTSRLQCDPGFATSAHYAVKCADLQKSLWDGSQRFGESPS